MKSLSQIVIACALIFLLGACSSSRTVERVDPNETIDLSGRWNDTDSRLVAEEMIKDMLNRPWRTEFETRTGNRPRLIVGTISNKSHEHIATQTFITDIEREAINSGLIKLAQGKDARDEIREERADQQAEHTRGSFFPRTRSRPRTRVRRTRFLVGNPAKMPRSPAKLP